MLPAISRLLFLNVTAWIFVFVRAVIWAATFDPAARVAKKTTRKIFDFIFIVLSELLHKAPAKQTE